MPQNSRWARWSGLTLIEVMVSIALVMVIVMGAMTARYLTVQQAVRADAYNTAGRVALLLLEGWRSTEPNMYDPASTTTTAPLKSLSSYVTITGGATGCPQAPSGFITLNNTGYLVVADRMNFYVTLAYTNPDLTVVGAEHPPKLHVAVAFLNHYGTGDASTSSNRVSLTTYR